MLVSISVTASAGNPDHEIKAPILHETQGFRLQTWRLQDEMGLAHTRTTYSDRKSPSKAYRLWVNDLWEKRLKKVKARYKEWKQQFAYGVWDELAICETGGNWQHYNSTYQGGLGFYHGSWDAYKPPGFPADAHIATREQQIVVGQRILDDVGWGAWPACSIRLGLR